MPLKSDRLVELRGVYDEAALRANLEEGRFRLIMVLDSTPAELARVTAYLAAIAQKVTIDLVVGRGAASKVSP
jgi:hypothetical protein